MTKISEHPFFCINLDTRPDRLRAALKNLPTFRRIKAATVLDVTDTDLRKFETSPISTKLHWPDRKKCAAIACRKSHEAAVRAGLATGSKFFTVFADDAEVGEDWDKVVSHACDVGGFDLLLWGCRPGGRITHIAYLPGNRAVAQVSKARCLHAYTLTPEGGRKLLEFWEWGNWIPDVWWSEQRSLNAYAVMPGISVQSDGYSDLAGRHHSHDGLKKWANLKSLATQTEEST